MLDQRGSVSSVLFTQLLWTLPLAPLAGALILAHLGLAERRAWRRGEHVHAVSPRLTTRVTLGALFGAVAALGYAAFVLGKRPEQGRALFAHGFTLFRIGQLDLGFDASLDPLAAIVAAFVCVVSIATAWIGASSAPRRERGAAPWIFHAYLLALTGAALFAVVADNLTTFAFGWATTVVAAYGMTALLTKDAVPRRRLFVAGYFGLAGLLLSSPLLFWGFGGSWTANDYVPDLDARFTAVVQEGERRTEAGAEARAFLSLRSAPGAVVLMDEARVPVLAEDGAAGSTPARAPFARIPIPPGSHTFRIHTGALRDDLLVSRVVVDGGQEVTLVPVGPVLGFRELREQLALTNAKGQLHPRDTLLARSAFGRVGFLTAACVLLFFAVAPMVGQVPLHGWVADAGDALDTRSPGRAFRGAAFVAVVALLGAVALYLLARVAFLFALSPAASRLATVVGGLTALYASILAVRERRPARLSSRAVVAGGGAAIVAFGVGKTALALGVFAGTIALFGAVVAWAVTRASDAPPARAASDPVDGAVTGLAVALSSSTQRSVGNVELWVLGAPGGIVAVLVSVCAWLSARLERAMGASANLAAAFVERVVPSPPVDALEAERAERRVAWSVMVALIMALSFYLASGRG